MAFYFNKVCIKIEFSFILIIAYSLVFNNNILYILLFSTLHEAGHLAVLIINKNQIKSITFAYFGIGLKYKQNLSFINELIFYNAGIIVNLIFYILNVKKQINIALIFTNILPIYPLDGGRILKLIIDKVFNINISYKLFVIVDFVFIVLFILIGIICKNLSLIFISVYIIIYSIENSFD